MAADSILFGFPYITMPEAATSSNHVAVFLKADMKVIEKGETLGFMKVVVDAETQDILGAAILGIGGDEAIHGILDAMYAKAKCETLKHAVHIHPTVSELIPTMLGQLRPLR